MQLQQLPFLLPNDEEKAIISRDVRVDSDQLKNGIRLFREWLQCESYLPNDVDQLMIRNFLYGCNGNLETAKIKFEKYMVNRTKLRLIYGDRQGNQKLINAFGIHRIVWESPKLTPQGRRVICFSFPTDDSTHFDCIETYKRLLLQLDVHLFADENAGYEFVYNAINFSLAILSKLHSTLALRILEIMYSILPFRVKKILVINTTPAMDILLDMIRKVISQKLRERIYHIKIEEVTQYVPRDCLPNEYGGTAGEHNVLCDRYNDFLVENSEWTRYTEGLKLTGSIPGHKEYLLPYISSSS